MEPREPSIHNNDFLATCPGFSPAHIPKLALLALLCVPLQDSPDKALDRLRSCMNEGRFVEGRAVAGLIVQKYPGTSAAEAARPYLEDNAFLTMAPLEFRGPMANRVDLTVMADGLEYDDRSQKAWQREAETDFKALFKSEVLQEYESYFNLFRAQVASKEFRLNKRDGPAVTYFKGRESEGELFVERSAAREVAGMTGSNDRLALVQVRPGGQDHGASRLGVAIFGSPQPSPASILHAFGHAFAGLADEASSQRGWGGMDRSKKDPPPIPEAPNVSDSKDLERVPWAHWLKAKSEGDKRAARVGLLEGAALRPQRVWRPVDESLCVMNSGTNFCPVCREVVVLLIYSYVRPIDGGLPSDKVITVEAGAGVELWVQPMKPATRRLAVGWIVDKAEGVRPGADAEGKAGDEGTLKKRLRCGDGAPGLRRGEGQNWRMPKGETFDGDARKETDRARESFTVNNTKLAPGRYRITAVVRDMTEWVLRDTQNLLVDWRTWVVEIK
ncbi:MAG TPA: M64 family metallopeptidase [Planctomycetota bacterium]|nr:M64 family metallopeptidase [Planctomycetota bacterium]